jgi:arylsulfatase A-like enzyme
MRQPHLAPIPAIVVGLAVLAAGSCSWTTREPNVLVVVVDSLRADALVHTPGAPSTPAFAALEQDGVRFRTAFSPTPAGGPAVAALFTGRLPSRAGVLADGSDVDPDVPLLAEALAHEGYQTLAVVGLADLAPRARGEGLDRGFASFETPPEGSEPAERTTARALAALGRVDPQKPWLLYVHYADPREPYAAHGTAGAKAALALDGRTLDTLPLCEDDAWQGEAVLSPGRHKLTLASDTPFRLDAFACRTASDPIEPSIRPPDAPEGARSMTIALENRESKPLKVQIETRLHDVVTDREARRRYGLEVESADRALGTLLAALREGDQYDTTLVVLTSNHGAALGQHAGTTGAGLYDEELRVPLVIKPPAKDPHADRLRSQSDVIARLVDVTPTVLDLLGEDALPSAAGRSLLDKTAARLVTAEVGPPLAQDPRCALRDERYKLIYVSGEDRYEMYDLARDPLELDNVFAIEGHLWADWQRQLRSMAQKGLVEPSTDRDAMAQRARVLGY